MLLDNLDEIVDGFAVHLCHIKLEDHLLACVLQQGIQQPHLGDAELQVFGYGILLLPLFPEGLRQGPDEQHEHPFVEQALELGVVFTEQAKRERSRLVFDSEASVWCILL